MNPVANQLEQVAKRGGRLIGEFTPSFALFSGVLLGLTAAAGLFFVVGVIHYLPVTGDNLYPESAGVLAVKHWADGQSLYRDYRNPPYTMTAFPPLWYVTLGAISRVTHLDLDSVAMAGRSLSLVSLCGILSVAYLLLRRFGVVPKLALLGITFYLSLPVLIPWAVTARPDFPALLVALAALYLGGTRDSTRTLVLAGLLASISFLMRHNSVAVSVALVSWLVWSKRWKSAVVVCVIWGAIVAGVLIPIQVSTGGLLGLNLSSAKFGSLAPTYVRDVLMRLLQTPGSGFTVVLIAFGLFGLVQSVKLPDSRVRLLAFYAVASLAFGTLGSAAAGGAVNHYLEPALAFALLVPFGLQALQQSWPSHSQTGLLVLVLIGVLLLPSLDSQRWNAFHERPEDLRQVAALVQGRRILTDLPFLAARSGNPGLIDLASLINTQKSHNALSWSSEQVSNSVARKDYEVILLSTPVEKAYIPNGRYPRWPRLDAHMKAAIANDYSFCFELQNTYIYAPKVAPGQVLSCPAAGLKN